MRPLAMMTTSSHTSSTRSSWWLEKMTPTPAAARSRTTSVIVAMPIGSRPLNGSSRTSSSGSWARATASWMRCWLPCDSSSSLDFVRSARPIRSSQRAPAALALARRQPVLLGEVRELLADPHPRIQAALLGHVAEAQPRLAADRRALPADLAAIRSGQPEDAAHRRGLARAVGSQEADDPPGLGLERRAVQGGHGPVALGQVDDLEHVRPPSMVAGLRVLRLPEAPDMERPRVRAADPGSRSGEGNAPDRRAATQLAVIVPVMSGWTSHRNG